MKNRLNKVLNKIHFYNWKVVYRFRDKLAYKKIEAACKNPSVPETMGDIPEINFYRTEFISDKNKELVELCKRGETDEITKWYGKDSGDKKYYDEYLKHRMSLRVLCMYIERQYPKCRILDIACGHGEMSVYLARKGYQVYGLDLNEYRVASLKGRLADVRCESAENTTYTDSSFDIVIACETLEHVADLEKVLFNMRRLVIQGGAIIITVPYGHLIDYDSHVRIFNEENLTAVVRKAGFKVKCLCRLPYLNNEKDNDLFLVAEK